MGSEEDQLHAYGETAADPMRRSARCPWGLPFAPSARGTTGGDAAGTVPAVGRGMVEKVQNLARAGMLRR